MKHLLSRSLLALVLAAGTAAPAAAQSDILLRLRSGSPLGDRFRVDSAGGMVAVTRIGLGIIPATGAGDRFMWHPFRGSIRAGGVDGTQWDDGSTGFYSAGMGYNATASGIYSVSLGNATTASGQAAIALGSSTSATNTAAVAMGASSSASGFTSLAFGFTSNATGQGSVAIGYRTTADADYSVAIGYRASTNGRTGATVFADASTTDSLEASANNQFSVRAAGGYRLYTNATTTAGVTMNAGGSSWNAVSDRNRKELFLAVDNDDVLSRIRSLPVTTWRYIAEEDRAVRHIGPMAQDWHRAFGFSGDDTTINMSDFDGVNLAAIQALDQGNLRQDAEIQSLRAQVADRDARIETLEARIARLEALLTPAASPAP
jgi:Head domain of trimeric autotransporter adhesin/Chaperone of endosialidase